MWMRLVYLCGSRIRPIDTRMILRVYWVSLVILCLLGPGCTDGSNYVSVHCINAVSNT